MHAFSHKTMKNYVKSTLRDTEDTEKWIPQKFIFVSYQLQAHLNWTLVVSESSK